MKKYLFKILLLFSSLCISLTSCNIKNLLKRPKDWNEEFWFLDKIEGNIDLNKYFFYTDPFCFGCSPNYYLKNYGEFYYDENGNINKPLKIVLYTIDNYPDLSSKEKHVISLYISDENVSFYNLTVNSSINEFKTTMLGFDFSIKEEKTNYIYLKKDNINAIFDKRSEINNVTFFSERTNKEGIVY